MLPSISSFGDGLGARVVAGCCLSVVASIAVVAYRSSFDRRERERKCRQWPSAIPD